MKYYSQCGEDKWIIENLQELVKNKGVFVEVGGQDGVGGSNTLAFEELGWTGLIVEPDIRSLKHLKENRPNCIIEDCAIDNIEANDITFYADKEVYFSGLEQLTNDCKKITVNTKRLDTILLKHNIKHINLLSIDTESTEIRVWDSRGKFNPDILIIEYKSGPRDSQLKQVTEQITKDGYNLVKTTEYNCIFIKN